MSVLQEMSTPLGEETHFRWCVPCNRVVGTGSAFLCPRCARYTCAPEDLPPARHNHAVPIRSGGGGGGPDDDG